MGVQGRQQKGAQQARGIQAKQQQQATAQRNKQIQQRKTQQRDAAMQAGVKKRIGSMSSEQLSSSPQFMQALALRLQQNPSLVPTPEPEAPAAPAAPTQDQLYQEALARQRASSGSHKNDSSPWYFMPGNPGGPPL